MISFRENADAPAAAEYASALVAACDRVFAPDGWLATQLGLEHRPQQEAMAQAVIRNFVSDRSLLFEAGTGVGKSLAYLVPGILRAVVSKRPFLVSTHTIALQQQLLSSDIPLVRTLFQQIPELADFRNFKATLLVGRGNYLCGHRLSRAIATKSDLFGGTQEEDLLRIADWSTLTKAGLRDELSPAPDPEVWDWVNADSSACNKKNCSPETCFYRRAQQARRESQLVVLNHSLLFSLIAAGLAPGDGAGVLYPEDYVVLDEAHTVPNIATDHYGLGVSSYSVDRALKLLYNPTRKKGKGLLAKVGNMQDHRAVTEALAASEGFFNDLRSRLLRRQDIVRLHEADWAEPVLHRPLGRVADRLGVLRTNVEDGNLKDELGDHRRRLQEMLTGLQHALDLKHGDKHVYWLELAGRKKSIVQVRSAPLDVAEALRTTLFRRGTSVLMTSATLATGGDMSPFARRSGADGEDFSLETSPFDFENNLQIFIAEDAPQPRKGEGQLDRKFMAETIAHSVKTITGGTLVLFTSYADLRAVGEQLGPVFAKAGRPLLMQGQGLSRAEIKSQFMEAGNGVLFGTESFWTGFDAPGEALSQVIITRLPFDVPTHPVLEARSEWIRQQGGSPFAELTLPDAVTRFRQGVGRLLRKHSDRGRLIVLDSRILHKEYGRYFLAALPKRQYTKFCRADRSQTLVAE
ncbi:ATP-dependent DNA helicase [Cerasicoccus arenae]|uniref:Helicase n=1 Tax=Cerasicoccus arenae TaxID=424488 RepID=A0A8J3DA32_9BACT|nr:helicase C-terminal domain-containing protein [Cerasicoccus arenae]MBK1857305.1 ATP-dependent DNA helicase [Cerasicoccus arenae]GHC00580.1 helicase [Cerasicoccus arenae]